MYGTSVNLETMHEYQLCMDTTNLKLNDNNNNESLSSAASDQVQIVQQQNLINLNTSNNLFSPLQDYGGYYNDSAVHRSSSPVLITNLDQQHIPINKIKVEQVQNDIMNDSNQKDTQYNAENNYLRSSSSGGGGGNNTANSVSTKICKVCGDKSLGYNFSQVTCESCKAFFRRNALRNKQFKCPFTDNCEIDVITRRFCQKCRLKKCFAIGMKSEWILSDEEKRQKRLKIEENKKKRRTRHLTSPYYSIDGSNYGLQSNASSSSSHIPSLPPSALIPLPANSLNPIVYDSQIDDSTNNNGFLMQSTPPSFSGVSGQNVYPSSFNSNGGFSTEQIQQPEIVNQLVHSHYEQYKSSVDYDPLNSANWEASPQYSNTAGGDHFFSDSTNSPATTFSTGNTNNHSTNSSLINSPLISNVFLYNTQSDLGAQYSPEHTAQNSENDQQQQEVRQPDIGKFLKISCLPDNQMLDEIFKEAISAKLQPNCCAECNHSRDNSLLSPNEIELIDELKYATSNVGCVMNALTTGESIAPENVIFELLRMTDYAVRKSVVVAKKMSFFRSLCEEDQISALKGSSIEMMLCRTISMYDESTDSIIKHELAGKPRIRLDILKSIREEIYYDHKEMILSFKKELRQDTTLVSILMAILFFRSDRPYIKHRTTMKYIQSIYRTLLQRYIYVKFSKENMPIYDSLIQILAKLRKLNEKYIKTYVQLNSDILGPLLMEVFEDFGS